MKFEIRVTSDEGEVYAGEGPTMRLAAKAFYAAMTNAPEPLSSQAADSWEKFHRQMVRMAKVQGLS